MNFCESEYIVAGTWNSSKDEGRIGDANKYPGQHRLAIFFIQA